MKIVSDVVFYWFVIGMLFAVSFGYLMLDLTRVRRYFRTPVVERTRDELFGLCMGVLLCLYGLGGLVKHFAGW